MITAPLALFAISVPAGALSNGVGVTPPMGWNDWNTFGCSISDTLIRGVADAMVSSGMAAAGYQYVNIDDCWAASTRDADGNLRPDPNKFPNGIKPVADYVHGKGLKLGIYAEAGSTTCAGYPGSLGHEQQDANLFASWGIDYLKYDNCGDHGGLTNQQRYTTMRDALKATGRPIFYNLCEWGQDAVWTWGAGVGNSWRDTSDIQANWGSIMSILDSQVGLDAYSGPGGWNDPDMLEVGNSGLSDTESRAHFSLWALLNAPLIAGNDIRSMSAGTAAILTNSDVIAVDQNWGGRQGRKLRDDGDQEVWAKPMSNGSVAVVLLNRGGGTAAISTTAAALGLATTASYSVRDLWAHTSGTSTGTITASVPSHGAAMYVVTGTGMASASPTASATTSRGPSPSPSRSPSQSPSPSQSATPSPSRSPSPSPTAPTTGVACTVGYTKNEWPGGLTATVTVTNTGSTAVNGWVVRWTFPGDTRVTNAWNATLTQTAASVSASNVGYNGVIAPGANASFGFQGTWTGNDASPTGFTVNGVACAAG
jgi:alpha-galactosidase